MSTKTVVRPKILAKLGRKIAPNDHAPIAPVYDYAKLRGFFFKCFRVEGVVTSFDGILLTFRPIEQNSSNKKDLLNRFEISQWVFTCRNVVEKKLQNYVKEVRASHNALWLRYDFDVISPTQLLARIEKLFEATTWKLKKNSQTHLESPVSKKMVKIPVYFGGEGTKDCFKEISQVLPLRGKDFISRCTSKTYKVCAFSFNMGMPVLDELDENLRIPMKDFKLKERKIPAGSVVVAENFISVALFEQHGNWKIIGKVCVDLLKKDGEPIFSRGDQLSFVSVGKSDFSRYLREKKLNNQ